MHNTFHARVIAARLGADGVMAQLRGSVDGPYPIGNVSVWVDENDADFARQLLLADEVESAFDLPDEGDPWEPGRRRPFFLGLTVNQLVAMVGIVAVVTGGLLARLLVW